ncbi:DDE-type integrase/transposase/recombinase [Petroclostridium sp. X23]|uniref:DDE-type integrase/transposase/recombinase n=1 Tax=Petroclostridium sp. X23 TaxID=3045146 RepID=UPI0024AD589D|nr:DDE-type integrase/transposase/recombinase [Petroclostridium sp. X23]WHH61614.1 DDE-type integrase/transposase/recombinase [Petroclostridium sp. X23]
MDVKRSEEIAANRLKLITPLLDTALDKDKRQQMKEELCFQTGFSERTIRRYLQDYNEKGFEGLKPKNAGRSGQSIIPEEVIQEAVQLRREVPKRSISEIIKILEWEGKAEPGMLKRSTLQDQLTYRGYSSRQMRTYHEGTTGARRFQKPWRNYLWQSDIKYGVFIDGKPTYMVCFLDDATRMILHSEFYMTLDQKIVQDCFRKALMKYGAPDSVYFDNGKQYRTNWMQRACGKLGIRLLYCRPYAASSKGKVERYNQTVDSFLREVQVAKPKSLEELNRLYNVWMEECYLHKAHSALDKGMSPYEDYQSDSKKIRLLSPEEIADAFLDYEKRKVDKSGCINFMGMKYEVELGIHMVGKTVDVIFDAADVSAVSIECPGIASCSAKPLKIQSHSGPRPRMPEHLQPIEVETSRMLNAAQKRNVQREKNHKMALSFKGLQEPFSNSNPIEKTGDGNV